jgi:hypothetical protein
MPPQILSAFFDRRTPVVHPPKDTAQGSIPKPLAPGFVRLQSSVKGSEYVSLSMVVGPVAQPWLLALWAGG